MMNLKLEFQEKKAAVLWLMCVASIGIMALSSGTSLYLDSFRHGSTQVTEATFDVNLTQQDAAYKQRIKDARAEDRYLLTVLPQGPEADNQITSWQVKLRDLRHGIYDNILLPMQDSFEAKNNLGWLNPSRYSAVPIGAERIIKVDSFYVVLKVKGHHFSQADSPYLDSMIVSVRFINSDPRSGAQ